MGIIIRNTRQGGRITFRGLGLGGRITSGWPVASTSALLLDTYPGAAAAYSLRKLRTAYNGSAIRVRRSSDNAETDIGFISNALDTSSLNTFVGANSGFVTTWYDQSGNSYNVTQSTAGNQPRVVNAGTIETSNNLPTIRFIRASSTFLKNITLSTSTSTIRYISSVQKINTFNDYGVIWANDARGSLTPTLQLGSRATPALYIYDGGSTVNYAIFNRSELFLNTLNNTISYLSSQYKVPVTTSQPFNGLSVGSTTIGDYLDGYVSEFIFYNSSQSSNINNIENNVSTYFTIKPSNSWYGNATRLLDTYPASAAYSIRNLSSTYTGALLRVRRSSDNTELDIFGTTLGVLDTATLLTFCGAGNGFITTWYDQSGGYSHLIQATQANQPQIVSSGVYLGYLLYDGVNDSLSAINGSISWNGSTGASITTVSAPDATTPNGSFDTATIVQIPETAGWGTIYQTVGPTFLKWRFGTGQTSNDESYTRTSSTSFCLVNTNKNSATETLYLNNSLVKTSTGKNTTLAGNSSTNINVAIGAQPGYWKGFAKEIILYSTDQSANISNINTNINSYYSIY